jgi:hypothetical protein
MEEVNFEEDGGGVWGTRIAFDLLFYIVIGVLLSNIVTGIILDTFGEMRSAAAERAAVMASTCFMSGIHRQKFNEAGLDFNAHNSMNPDATNYVW